EGADAAPAGILVRAKVVPRKEGEAGLVAAPPGDLGVAEQAFALDDQTDGAWQLDRPGDLDPRAARRQVADQAVDAEPSVVDHDLAGEQRARAAAGAAHR